VSTSLPLSPPWIAYPNLPRASAGWRKGVGGDHFVAFCKAFAALSPDAQAAIERRFPEPGGWIGFYEMVRTLPYD
jgi:hypothetical protein